MPGLRRWLPARAGGIAIVAIALPSLALALAAALPDDSPAPAASHGDVETAVRHGGTGRLRGTVAIGRRLAAKRIRFNLYGDTVPPSAPPAEDRGEIENVVVYFEAAPSLPSAPPSRLRPQMRQEGLTFVPHVLAVPRGSTVEFPNADAIFHNVFSLSHAATFDLGRYPNGSTRSVTFPEAGAVKVFCHIHSDMSAVILVLDNAFFARPDAAGRYTIDGVPPGEYRVTAWHERARPLSRTVTIRAGAPTGADFTIPLTDEAPSGD